MINLDTRETKLYQLRQIINQLNIEIRYCEEWLERTKDTADAFQDMIFDLEEKKYV